MGKWNCCVPGCTNNWRNSPSLPFHRIPLNADIRVKYDRLVRNDNLKLSSSSTRICGAHFPGNVRAFVNQLPSIFPWTKDVVPRRVIVKHSLPLQEQKRRKVVKASEPLEHSLSDIDQQEIAEINTNQQLEYASVKSELHSGSISDPDIVKKSGYLEKLQKGDVVMADKGFLIRDELAEVGASLVMPNFLKGKNQFTAEESTHNKKIAVLRIHVERCMERLKNWHIFDRSMPILLADTASDTWIVVACISNFWPPLIY